MDGLRLTGEDTGTIRVAKETKHYSTASSHRADVGRILRFGFAESTGYVQHALGAESLVTSAAGVHSVELIVQLECANAN